MPLILGLGAAPWAAAQGPPLAQPGADTIPPQLAVTLHEQSPHQVVLAFRASDPSLDAASLKCTAWLEASDGSRTPVPTLETRQTAIPGGLQGQAVWGNHRPGRFVARVEVRDAARNIASQEKSTVIAAAPKATNQLRAPAPTRPAVVQSPATSFPGVPRVVPAQMLGPAAGPGVVAPPPISGVGEESGTFALPAPDEPPLEDVPEGEMQLINPGAPPGVPADLPPPVNLPPPSPQAEIQLRAARNSVALGDLPEALTRFEEYLKLTPQDAPVRYEYAGLLMQHRQLASAQIQFERLVSEQPNVPLYRQRLAELLLRLKNYDRARENLRILLTDQRFGLQAAILLARSYVLERQIDEAQRIYDERLRNATQLTVDEQRALALLLIDLERPDEAIRLLQGLHESHRDDQAITIALIQGYVRANRRLEALELISGDAQRPFKDSGAWLELGLELYREQAYPEAKLLLQRVCTQQPGEVRAQLGLARSHLRLYEVDACLQILNGIRGDRTSREFTTVLADYHTMVGEYSEALAIAKRRLTEDPQDFEAAILLGNALQASAQLQAANAAFQSALQCCDPADDEKQREIRRLIAANLLRRRLFDEARACLDQLLTEHPTDVASRILLIETMVKVGDFVTAAALANSAPKETPARARMALQIQLGYALLEQGRDGEAAQQFRMLAADRNAAFPDVAYGLYRAAQGLKQPQMAREGLALGPSPIAPPASWGAGFADRALTFCDCAAAVAVLDDALKCSPGNLALLTRRGEAGLICDCSCGVPNCRYSFPKIMRRFQEFHAPPPSPMPYFQAALDQSPTNIRARLGVARTLKKQFRYEKALAEYMTLLKFLPNDVNLVRETARMVEGWKGIERSGNFYVNAQKSLASEGDPAVGAEVADKSFGTEALVGTDTPETPSGAPPDVLLGSELSAKYLRGWKFREATGYYQGLIEMEPTNEAALFDLAQSQSAIFRTRCAVQTYQQLLDVNPCHIDAQTALARSQLEMRPKVIPAFDFQFQQGRDGLANMTWQNYALSERQPLGDENEYFEFGYRQRVLQPTDDRVNPGEIPFMHWREKYRNDATVFVDLAVEQYQYGFQTRPTFNVGIDIFNVDKAMLTWSGFLKNYYANGEAIRQDIYWGGTQIDLVLQPMRLWTISGFYRVAAFSDHNAVNWFDIISAHTLMQGRQQVRGIIDYSFYSFANQTVFGPDPDSLVGTQFPYWSPSGYSFVTSGVEIKEWLSCDAFKGGNEKYYTWFVGGAVDSNGDGYFITKARWQHDFSPMFSWTTDANLTWSANKIYNAVGLATYAVIRIP